MSGNSYDTECPNCGNENYMISEDWKPFDMRSTFCLDCGFQTYTHISFASLEELNIERSEFDDEEEQMYPPLSKRASPNLWARNNMKHYLTKEDTNDR